MRSFEQRKTENKPSSPFFAPTIQKKLKTGTVGDKYEVEADKVADKVVNTNSNGSNGLFQSKKEWVPFALKCAVLFHFVTL